MSAVVTQDLTKTFRRRITALDRVSLTMEPGCTYGLLGRNGAGKSTLMALIAGQDAPTSGSVEVFGHPSFDNPRALRHLCFLRENQRYPDDTYLPGVLKSAAMFYPRWDADLAAVLVQDFQIPADRLVKKLSRGQLSAVGATLGLASRADVTFFDEPYLGLDSVSRSIFYRHLTQSQTEHPRTVLISSHLIDEVANLLDHVFVLNKGRLVLDAPIGTVQESAVSVEGPAALVKDFLGGTPELSTTTLGGMLRVLVYRPFSDTERKQAAAMGLEIQSASLQDLLEGVAK